MRQSANPAPAAERRAGSIRPGLILLGIMLAANAVDLLSRQIDPGTGRTPLETFVLILQAGVCVAILLLVALSTLSLGVRARKRLPCGHGPASPQPAELN